MATPVTSPRAHSPSATRQCSSTGGAGLQAGADVDAVAAQVAGEEVTDPRLFPVQQPGAALDDGDLGAHAGQKLAQLDADRAAADHHHPAWDVAQGGGFPVGPDRKSTRLNSSHVKISYAVFCL